MRDEYGKLDAVVLRVPDPITHVNNRDATTEISPIHTISKDPRSRLTSESEEEETNETINCPEIDIEIENVKVWGLVDTGSPITCIFEDLYNENVESFKACAKLPIIGQIIKGAIGTKRRE